MNYKKGFFRITLIISIVSVIIGLSYGINEFSSYFKEYERNLEFRQTYYSSMSKLLNEDIDNFKKDSLTIKRWEIMEQPKIKLIGEIINDNNLKESRLDLKSPPVQSTPIYYEEKNFKVKRKIIENKNLSSESNETYISVKHIIDLGVNKKINLETKNIIANEYANSKINAIWPLNEALIYLLLIPLLYGSVVWIIFYVAKFIIRGFTT